MAFCNTSISQILKFVPRHELKSLAKQHHSGRTFRKASRCSKFVPITMAQLLARNSFRDIVDNMMGENSSAVPSR
jgi:putative transposase